LLVHSEFREGDRVRNQLHGSAQIERPDEDRAAARAAFQEAADAGHEHGKPQAGPGLVGVNGAELNRVFVRAGIPIADQLLGSRVEVLLAHLDVLAERRRHRVIQDLRAAT